MQVMVFKEYARGYFSDLLLFGLSLVNELLASIIAFGLGYTI